MHATPAVRALVFDIFGTVVDWRSSLIREGQALGQRLGLAADWPAFADAWRAGYRPAMARVSRGELPWINIDGLHRLILDELLPRFGLESLPETERDALNRAWHRLDPWPDAVPGLTQLRQRFVLSTLSNGNVALLVNMAKRAGLPWDCVLSAELIGRYKPDLEVYRRAAQLLGFAPEQVLMVAAHPSDLMAAQQAGLKTAYIPRPAEHGPGGWMESTAGCRFDWQAPDLPALAQHLA
ncbi:haloacid dehalogenase type II [Aquabacterium sp.]|uniref:haloacid dehalogenase type II n=1 Tax=Aquabacterium sp. TaxID=1872578 RepID=UPI002C6E3B9E|nr:haloacid dehalogenase type II [Aquabacterium sp.]HSW04805.1 haloacid dehalogenase type II [Aquabacterium sp.]